MRVVIDTNVFISSFFGGNPRRIINLWKEGYITLCLCSQIIDEYIDVLSRLGMKDEKELQELLSLFSTGFNLLFTKKTPKIEIVQTDPADNKFIECAVALKAEAIITGDKHLLTIKKFNNIQILTPKEFLEIFV